MKQIGCITILVLSLWSCKHHSVESSKNTLGNSTPPPASEVISSEMQSDTSNIENAAPTDSTVFLPDSLFFNLASELKEISTSEYSDFKKKHNTKCIIASNGFVQGKALTLRHHCKEICESYLVDKQQGIKLLLPSNYDQGIMGLDISPSCNQFIVYSSYDGPDYTNFYEYRAEIYGFSIAQGQGIQIIHASFKFTTMDWSIEEAYWINDHEIAIKAYQENRTAANQDQLKYKYFKTRIEK